MNFVTYKWHSVNLVPTFAYSAHCEEAGPPYGRSFELTWLGQVMRFDTGYLFGKSCRMRFTPTLGPFWSRRRKCWYWRWSDEMDGN